MPALLTTEELHLQYQISVKRIYALVRAGKLRAIRLPGSRLLRFDPENLTVAESSPASSAVLLFPRKKKAA